MVDAIAVALGLDVTGRAHLGNLIGVPPAPHKPVAAMQRVRRGVRGFIDSLDRSPAMILGRRTDVLATNAGARTLIADFDRMGAGERNYARWIVTSAEARELFIDWEVQARVAVENLRLDVGNDPGDPAAVALVAELSDVSPEFRAWWSQHRVNQRTHGTKRLRHPIGGELSVDYETFLLPGDPGQTLFVFTAPEGSPSRRALDAVLDVRS